MKECKVYGPIPSCSKCQILKQKLDSLKIKYEYLDIEEIMDRLEKAGIMSAPVLELEDGTLMSFNEAIIYLRKG